MGAFAYSEEEGTYAAEHFKDDIPEEIKMRRLDEIMDIQQEISASIAADKVGRVMKVLIDRGEGDYYIGRTEYDSPEVDPEVLIPLAGAELETGCFYDVKVVSSDDFDLYGELVISCPGK